MAGKEKDPYKITIAKPGSMEREHMVNPFRATSPNPGFEYRKNEVPKKPTTAELEAMNQSVTISKDFELDLMHRSVKKRQALRKLAKICKQMKDEDKPTAFIDEFYIQLYNNKQIGMEDRIYADKQVYKTYCDLNRDDAREVFDVETGEPLKFTNSVWNPNEGRLDVDMNGILKMATGEFDIKRRAVNGDLIYIGSTPHTPKRLSPIKPRHVNMIEGADRPTNDIFKEFMERGPRTPIAHQYWSVKTGKVDLPEEEVDSFEDGEGMIGMERFRPTTSNIFGDDASIAQSSEIGEESTVDQFFSLGEVRKATGEGSARKGASSASGTLGSARGTSRGSARGTSRGSARGTVKGSARGTARSNTTEQSGGSKTTKASTTNTSTDRKKKKVEKREKLPNTIIKDVIDPTNKRLWGEIEKNLQGDLYKLLADMENNKFRTHEPKLPPVYIRDIYGKITGEEEPALVASKKLAKQMMHAKRDVVQAIEDEELRDAARKLAEDQAPNSKKLKEILKKNEKEKHNFRRYLRTLQYDNELVLINSMTKYGLLW